MKSLKKRPLSKTNVFQDLGFSDSESRILTLKAQLAVLIVKTAKGRALSQQDLGKLWKVPQPRVSEIMTGKLELISIERLAEFLAKLGVEVEFRRKSTQKKAM